MAGTMTWVGLDVHARSTHAAAIDLLTGELERDAVRSGVRGAGRVAVGAARVRCARVMRLARRGLGSIALRWRPGCGWMWSRRRKTPRASADRVKTDRKDAELLARLLVAGQLAPVKVPPAAVEAARDLTRLHEQVPAGSDERPPPGLEDAVASRPRLSEADDLEAGAPPLARQRSTSTSRRASSPTSTCSPRSTV